MEQSSYWINISIEILKGVISSLIAAAIFLGIAPLFSQKFRWVLIAVLGRLLNVDLDNVFADSNSAREDIERELKRAKRVDLYTGRGNQLQRETFECLLSNRNRRNKKLCFRILLPDVDRDLYWLNKREEELSKFDQTYGTGILKDQCEVVQNYLTGYLAEGLVELRKYSCPHVGRILITDKCAFFTPYKSDAHGRDCVVYKFRANDDFYLWCVRWFELIWNNCEVLEKPDSD